MIYAGPLGRHSHKLVEYFEVSYHFMPKHLYAVGSFVSYKFD